MRKTKSTRLESEVQSRIIKRYEADGWYVVKLMLTNKGGIPDLMCLKDGKALFIEVKRQGCKPRPLQAYRIKELQDKGFEVQVLTE